MRPIATNISACVTLASTCFGSAGIGVGCTHQQTTPIQFVEHVVQFRPDSLIGMDLAARDTFVASLRTTFAANGLDLQGVQYHNDVGWSASAQREGGGVETFTLSWARVLPFLVAIDRHGPTHAYDYGSCKIQLSEKYSIAVIEYKTGEETRETWSRVDAPRRLRTTSGDLVTRDELAQQRDETARRVQTALSAALPDGKFQDVHGIRMNCIP